MAVMPRESWTDQRLDDFRGEVNRRFDGVDMRLAEIRVEIHRLHDRMDAMNARFDSMQRALMQIGFVLVAALIGLIATLIATQL